jgi:hypothetical protein
MPESPTRVFISYSHDSTEHEARIRALADGLRADGVDCIIDQYFPHPAEGWPRWMEREIAAANFVLMICTEIYHRRVTMNEEPGKGHGVLWESNLIYNELYGNGTRNEKFIAALPSDGDAEHIPTPLRGFTHYRLGRNDQQLYDRLMKRMIEPPPLGQPKDAAAATANPFAWRAGVTDGMAFFSLHPSSLPVSATSRSR